LLAFEFLLETLEMINRNISELGDVVFAEVDNKLVEIFGISEDGRRGAAIFLKMFDKCFFLCLHIYPVGADSRVIILYYGIICKRRLDAQISDVGRNIF